MKCKSEIEVINGVFVGIYTIETMSVSEFKVQNGLMNEDGIFRGFKISKDREILHPDSGKILATIDKKYSTVEKFKHLIFKYQVQVEVNSDGEFLNKCGNVWNRRIESSSDMKVLGEPHWVYSEK
jgi:hypothetical protein